MARFVGGKRCFFLFDFFFFVVAACRRLGGDALLNSAFSLMLSAQHSVVVEHLSSSIRVLLQCGASLDEGNFSPLRLMAQSERALVFNRIHEIGRHPNADELFSKYALTLSGVAQGLEPKTKLL